MGESRRKLCDANTYHAVSRGVGRQIIFEDDQDRGYYLDLLGRSLGRYPLELYAWCLMANHVHLLFHGDMGYVSAAMNAIGSSYARVFNLRHGRSGHLFQGRFHSEAVATSEQLIATVRYIHQNPWKAGQTESCAYPWSSYFEYLGTPYLVKTDFVLEAFGDIEEFVRVHSFAPAVSCESEVSKEKGEPARYPMTDDDARAIAIDLFGKTGFREIIELPKPERNEAIRRLKGAGMSVRRIERLTGVGRGIVSRV